MEELVELLKQYFSKDTRYHSINEIKKVLELKGDKSESILKTALNTLIESGTLFYDKKGYRIFPKGSGYAFGEIEINKSGTGFVHTKDGYTILIENNDLNGALNGDTVIVNNIFNKRKDYYHGEIYKIVKRNTGNIVYEVIGNGKTATLVPYNIQENINININSNELKNLIDGDIILVKVGCDKNYDYFDATIKKIIGNKKDENIDIKLIAEKLDIAIEFSDEAIKEAFSLPTQVLKEDLIDRKDLRDENIFTIDCDNTKDRDDSVGIKKLPNGNYLLKVNIADVSHYIKSDSKLFEEALTRCSSHYPGNTVIPMFPEIISNGICSLNENVDRLTKTVEMEINSKGVIINYNIYNSVINSKKAMSYSKVNEILSDKSVPGYDKFKYDLNLMKELNTILENARNERNYINFDTKEPSAIKKGNSLEFKADDYGLAGQIIENFMLVANTTVYRHFAWFILAYRIHEAPNEDQVKEVLNVLRNSGIKIPKVKNIDSKSLKTIINGLGKDEVALIVREYILRSMKKARYDITNIGHFALQYEVYGHFTSPIRRIIDLITHMTIDNIEKFDYSKESIDKFEKFLKSVCDRANRIEKLDKILENETMDMYMAKEMSKHIGEKFEVYITDINSHSMLVRTSNLIRGKIRMEDMLDDNYHYDYDKKAIIGRNSKNKYQIGNKILVLVKSASKESRTIYFEIPKQKILNKIS